MDRWRKASRRTLLFVALASAGCRVTPLPAAQPPVRALGGVTIVAPRCVEVRSCLLGRVVAAESSAPLARAAVFIVPDPESARAEDEAPQIVRMTDEQGVFTVVDAPAGHYSVSVYKDARSITASGLELGTPGTQMVPIRLPPPS